ncbi:nucleotide triphosphate hydrolase [Pseudomonas phage phiH1]|uniref:Nucleotide triphosphate hydrolase n=1 Tax=Pseudomonas phage phiH1 TaxID=2982871 RepID=A0AAX3D1T5_9CAUD|nr:nucleotide triphosphate hydrolase [Pseudomonas phage phiH1]UYD21642.1 nucleotide triphosphate hydrolase [Pseudomonas phage phiH1]
MPSVPFNEERHRELVAIEMQPKFSGLTIDPTVTRKLMAELERIAGGW